MYGTLSDFGQLQSAGQKQGIRIILDLVLNHTSDQHQWFIDSRSSRTSRHRDWYIWRDGKSPNQPPNNWVSLFGGSAWQFDGKTSQYYYHFFYPQQPDLNWRNPAVRDAMFDVTRFWYERGVSGFRLDAVDTLFEDPELRDNPVLPGKNVYGDLNEKNEYNTKLPEVHDVMKGLRQVADKYNAVLIGETATDNIGQLEQYYGEHSNELQMPMDLMFAKVDKLSPPEFRRQVAAVNSTGGWPVYLIGNHDLERSYNRYGDGKHNDAIAKLMAGFYLTLRGTPILYYGEEIGMQNNDPKFKKDVKDPRGKVGWPEEKGRDGERTPMQWDNTRERGVHQGNPLAADTDQLQVPQRSRRAERSRTRFWSFTSACWRYGTRMRSCWMAITLRSTRSDPNVMSYLRRYKDKAVLVALNMSAEPQKVSFNLGSQGFSTGKLKTLLTTMSEMPGEVRISRDVTGAVLGLYRRSDAADRGSSAVRPPKLIVIVSIPAFYRLTSKIMSMNLTNKTTSSGDQICIRA